MIDVQESWSNIDASKFPPIPDRYHSTNSITSPFTIDEEEVDSSVNHWYAHLDDFLGNYLVRLFPEITSEEVSEFKNSFRGVNS